MIQVAPKKEGLSLYVIRPLLVAVAAVLSHTELGTRGPETYPPRSFSDIQTGPTAISLMCSLHHPSHLIDVCSTGLLEGQASRPDSGYGLA